VWTVLLLVVHVVLAAGLLFLTLPIAMSTDSCAYRECGSEDWILVAMFLATWVNGAVLVTDFVVSLAFITRRRRSAMVPAIGCGLHAVLIVAALGVASLAGPV